MEFDLAKGELFDATLWGFSIEDVKFKGKKQVVLRISRYVQSIENYWVLDLIIHFIDDDTFWIENEWLENNWDSFAGPSILRYRISGSARIPKKLVSLNDTRVRLCVKPNLNRDTSEYLTKDDKVTVKDNSKEKFEIDSENCAWYKVDSEDCPDG